MSAYVLTVMRGGPKFSAKFKRVDADKVDPDARNVEMYGRVGDTMQITGTDATLGELAGELQRALLTRPLVDQTGLEGRYHIELAFTARIA